MCRWFLHMPHRFGRSSHYSSGWSLFVSSNIRISIMLMATTMMMMPRIQLVRAAAAATTTTTTTTTHSFRPSSSRSSLFATAFVSHASSPRKYSIRSSTSRFLSTSSSTNNEPTPPNERENDFFAPNAPDFASIGVTNDVLLQRIARSTTLERPSNVQASAYAPIAKGDDVTIGSETGSGKTFAYLLPLLNDILNQKQQQKQQEQEETEEKKDSNNMSYDYARAFILVPNKELVQQVVRMAQQLCGGTTKCLVWGDHSNDNTSNNNGNDDDIDDSVNDDANVVRLAIMPGGLREPQDFPPFRNSLGLGGRDAPVDIVISTPAALGPMALKPKHIDMFGDVRTLIVDEADMLLDGGYVRQLSNVLMGFRRADKLQSSYGLVKTQHVFVAATLPDFGLRSVDAFLQRNFPHATRVTMAGMHNARHYGLREQTQWLEIEGKKARIEQLVTLLVTPPSPSPQLEPEEGEDREKEDTSFIGGGLQGEKVICFLNSVDDVEGANTALERAGIRTVPYHAKLSLQERTSNLDKFRRYDPASTNDNDDTVPILVSTDLASRGLDVPGVTAIVQLQFATNVVAHLHRMGRCGRAGNRDGRGIIFYSSQEKDLVQVIQTAEQEQERMTLEQDVTDTDLQDDDNDNDQTIQEQQSGTIKDAFSRKRAFTKKRKKLRRVDRVRNSDRDGDLDGDLDSDRSVADRDLN